MLKQRILTALVLASLVMAAIFLLPTHWFALVLLPVALIGAHEWAALAGLSSAAGRIVFTGLAGAVIAALWLAHGQAGAITLIAGAACLWWLFAVFGVLRYRGESAAPGPQWVWLLSGLLVLPATWMSMVALHGWESYGPAFVLFLFLLVWLADSGAYFAGKRWGRRRLAPALSPGKTREGAVGGILATLLVIVPYAVWLRPEAITPAVFVGVSVLAVIMSIFGDLMESLLKRRRGVKDSGRLLPGHGGMLDRIDSVTAAAPVLLSGLLAGTAA